MKYMFIIFILLASCTDKKPIPEISPTIKLEDPQLSTELSPDEPVSQEKIDAAFEKENATPTKEIEEFPTLEDLQKETLTQLKKENDSLSLKNHKEKNTVDTLDSNQKHFFIIVGSFKTNYFYEEMIKKISEEKLSFVTNNLNKNGVLFKTLKIGPINSKKEATSLLNKLKSKGFPQDSFIK